MMSSARPSTEHGSSSSYTWDKRLRTNGRTHTSHSDGGKDSESWSACLPFYIISTSIFLKEKSPAWIFLFAFYKVMDELKELN